MPRTRANTSPIWKYFEHIDKDEKKAICKYCKNTLSYKSTITNLKLHLRKKHFVVYEEFCRTDRAAARSEDRREAVKREAVLVPEWADVRAHFSRTTGGGARCAFCARTTPHDEGCMRRHVRACHPDVWAQRAQESAEESACESPEQSDHEPAFNEEYTEHENGKDIFTEVVYLDEEERTPKAVKRRRRSAPTRPHTSLGTFLNYIECLMRTLPDELATKTQLDIINLIMAAKLSGEAAAKAPEPKFNINISTDGNEATITPVTNSM